jgi:hypothetical protein
LRGAGEGASGNFIRKEDKHLLADIGLTRGQALREAGKPFWR